MANMSTSCPACGARLTRNSQSGASICGFCGYEQLAVSAPLSTTSPYDRRSAERSLLQLHRYCSGTNIGIENAFTRAAGENSYSPEDRDLDGIGSLYVPLFVDDLNDYFRERFLSLRTGGMLMVLCPVKSRWHTPAPPARPAAYVRPALTVLPAGTARLQAALEGPLPPRSPVPGGEKNVRSAFDPGGLRKRSPACASRTRRPMAGSAAMVVKTKKLVAPHSA